MVVGFVNRKGVHVGTHGEHGAARITNEARQHARRRGPADLQSAETGKRVGDESGRPRLLERELGLLVQRQP
jgi:hypothetical protein